MAPFLRISSVLIAYLALSAVCFPQSESFRAPNSSAAGLINVDTFLGTNVTESHSANSPQPPPEIQSLAGALVGTWSLTEQYEPDKLHSHPFFAHIQEIWRRGPGGFTLIQELRVDGQWPTMTLLWWDKTKGLQAMSCTDSDPAVCEFPGSAAAANAKQEWNGRQLVSATEFLKQHKKFIWREVLSDISPSSFTRTIDTGENGKRWKRWVTMRATRAAADAPNYSRTPSLVSPVREMRKLFALLGTWLTRLEQQGTDSGQGEQIWRPGPGGLSLIEGEHSADSNGEAFGLSIAWWDATAKSYRALWCHSNIDAGCIAIPTLARWQADEFVLDGEFEHDGKRLAFQQRVSEITPATFTQSRYQGDSPSELKPLLILRGVKREELSIDPAPAAPPPDM